MRAQFSVLYVLGYTAGALVIADQWLDHWVDLGSTTSKVAITVAVGASVLATAAIQIAGTLASNRARLAAETAAEERARLAAEIHTTIAERIHAIVVEVVAAHQAVVRGAYGDDILSRLTNADDSAHAALASLDRLIEGQTKSTEATGTLLPVA
jgi:signal transduction histidine kinase